jgi:hypothetical protein
VRLSPRSFVSVVVITAASGLGVLATPAQAAVTLGSCTGDGSVSISPGLRLAPATMATMTFTGTVTGCTGKLPKSGKISGTATALAPGVTCTSGAATGRIKITWANGKIDVIKATADTTTGFAGRVIKGPHLGAVIAVTGKVTPVTGNCIFTPLTKASFAGTASVTK